MIKKYLKVIILFSFILFSTCSWENEYKAAARRSLQPDTDLILVPYPHNIFDKEARESITLSHYSQDELKEILIEHEISWEELKDTWGWDENLKQFEKEVNYTSHYTHYPYDTNIPIWIYGPKWIKPGTYPDSIFQQHIPSIYAKILKFDFKNKIDTKDYNKIFTKNTTKPEIIVTIVVDQGGDQLYKAHPNSSPFLTSLKSSSAYFTKAKVAHLEAHTAVGHAAIGTGSFPKEMGTFSNEVYYYNNGSVNERKAYETLDKKINLNEMKTLSFADEWDRKNKNLPVVVSQCYAARASIGMAGHGSLIPEQISNENLPDQDFVYWENTNTLRWDTYTKAYSLPETLNNLDLYQFYIEKNKILNSEFKVKDRLDLIKKMHHFQASEYQVLLDGETFRTVVNNEIISKPFFNDGVTDLAFVTLKATDAVGHLYGWESKESENILGATDMEIRKIFDFLRSNYEDKFLLVVTADHGAAPMPEVSNASFLTHQKFFEYMGELLPKEFRKDKTVVKWITHSHMNLNREVMSEFNISEKDIIQKLKELTINNKPFFRRIWTRSDIESNSIF